MTTREHQTQTIAEETRDSNLLKCLDDPKNDIIMDIITFCVKKTFLTKDWIQLPGDVIPALVKGTPVIKKFPCIRLPCYDEMLRNEYELLTQNKHDHIVAVFCISDCQELFFVMEAGEQSLCQFLHTTDLNKYVETATGDNGITTNYTMRRCLVWLTQIADGLAHLHANNIIHRDVKSDNVLLFESGTICKVCDLDLSKPDSKDPKSYKGTDPYIAPEIKRDAVKSSYNKKVDCFSFGVLMRECLTRKKPTPQNTSRQVDEDTSSTQNFSVPSESVFGADADKTYKFKEILKNQMQLLLSDDPEERPTFNILIGRFSKLPINESELPKLEPPYVPGVENELTLFSSPKVPSCHRTGRTLFYSVSNPDFDGAATDSQREQIKKILDERSHQIGPKGQSELPNARHRFDIHSPGASNEFCRIEHIIASDDADEEQKLWNYCSTSSDHREFLGRKFSDEPGLSSLKFTVAKPQNPAEQEANEE